MCFDDTCASERWQLWSFWKNLQIGCTIHALFILKHWSSLMMMLVTFFAVCTSVHMQQAKHSTSKGGHGVCFHSHHSSSTITSFTIPGIHAPIRYNIALNKGTCLIHWRPSTIIKFGKLSWAVYSVPGHWAMQTFPYKLVAFACLHKWDFLLWISCKHWAFLLC